MSTNIASNACVTCRKQKRRCTKELPTCSLCMRLRKPCDYSESSQPSTSEDLLMLQNRIGELEARLELRQFEKLSDTPSNSVGSSDEVTPLSVGTTEAVHRFPAMFFLDAEIFEESRLTLPKPGTVLSSEIYALLGGMDDIFAIANEYFNTVHIWLPFVSKKRMELYLSNPSLELKSDLAALLLSMKLVISNPTNTPGNCQTPLYWVVKDYFSRLEASDSPSIHLLQSGILIAVYEIGHGIYPVAYLSPARCARLGQALGIDNRHGAPQMLSKKMGAWAENEELKRTWWAIMVLDRFVNIGIGGHSLATDEALKSQVLPADDSQWDRGEMTTVEPLYVATPTNVQAGPFARTCQAANLLGRFIRNRDDRECENSVRFQDAMQVHRTLVAFSKLLEPEAARNTLQLSPAMALCYTSMLHLYDPYACAGHVAGSRTVEEMEMQAVSIPGLKSVAADILQLGRLVAADLANNLHATSPMLVECLYQGAATYGWLVYETGTVEATAAYNDLRQSLKVLSQRWASATEYLNILDQAKEFLFNNNPML